MTNKTKEKRVSPKGFLLTLTCTTYVFFSSTKQKVVGLKVELSQVDKISG